ncbi:TPA: hypothetical protein QDA90_004267 [Burkholderia vietnamiensis]|nr:hypothetical protein [Burkholderia vietnamiensis]HDR9068938.1 hypothetical protein [Burkholderia vietnamiensis]
MNEPILSREQVYEEMTKRNPYWNAYGASRGVAVDLAIKCTLDILEKLCGEPRAWLVEGGRTYRDKAFIDASNADTSLAERNDGARKTALYALNRSKA